LDDGPVDEVAGNQKLIEAVEGRAVLVIIFSVHLNRGLRKPWIEEIVPCIVPQAG